MTGASHKLLCPKCGRDCSGDVFGYSDGLRFGRCGGAGSCGHLWLLDPPAAEPLPQNQALIARLEPPTSPRRLAAPEGVPQGVLTFLRKRSPIYCDRIDDLWRLAVYRPIAGPSLPGQRIERVVQTIVVGLGGRWGGRRPLSDSGVKRTLSLFRRLALIRPLIRGARLADGRHWPSKYEIATSPNMVRRWRIWRRQDPYGWDLTRRPAKVTSQRGSR
jgi:hypothetical protein